MIKKTYNSPIVKAMEINSDVLLKESVEKNLSHSVEKN